MSRVRGSLLVCLLLSQARLRGSKALSDTLDGQCIAMCNIRLRGGCENEKRKMPSIEEVYAFVAQKKVFFTEA